MSKRFHGVLAAALAFVLVLSLLPTAALPAQAAEGDVSSEGYVIFEETFDKNADGTLASGHTYVESTGRNGFAIKDGCLTDTNGTTNEYITFNVPSIHIPKAQGSRCYVGIKMEIFVKQAQGRKVYLQVKGKTANGTDVSGNFENIYGSSSITPTASDYGLFYVKDIAAGDIASLEIRVGARKDGEATNYVEIEGIRISLVLNELSGQQAVAQDIGRYLIAGNGYFQLQRDLTFTSYTSATDASKSVTDLIMGSNAVLDLNGYTLTIDEDSTLSVPVNAKIVDSSAGKTGKIVCANDALTIANTSHPTLPVWTGNGYVLTEPKLEADKHIMVVADSQNHDKFTLHLRPGFGTLANGTVNVREAYLSKGNSGITMSAFITSVDLYGNRYNLQDNGSEEIVLDGMFDGMYASNLARCQIAFEGFEKYQALEITIKLSSDGVVYTLPTYTVENTYVTKHYASKFDTACTTANLNTTYGVNGGGVTSVTDAGKLNLAGGTSAINLENAISTGTGNTLVMEFDLNAASEYVRAGFEVRGSDVNGSPRYYVFDTNDYETADIHNIVRINVVGEKHIRLEINLDTFATVCTVDGVRGVPVSPNAADVQNYLNAWNGKAGINVSGTTEANALVIDNLLIYTIKTA